MNLSAGSPETLLHNRKPQRPKVRTARLFLKFRGSGMSDSGFRKCAQGKLVLAELEQRLRLGYLEDHRT